MAQLVERRVRNAKARGSNPLISTICYINSTKISLFSEFFVFYFERFWAILLFILFLMLICDNIVAKKTQKRREMKKTSISLFMFAIGCAVATFLLGIFVFAFGISKYSSSEPTLTNSAHDSSQFETIDGDFKIYKNNGKTTIKIEIDDKESEYGDPLVPLTCRIVEGELLGDDTIYDVVELSTEVSEKYIGEYDIEFSVINDNYEVTADKLGVYTLTQRKISVQVQDATSIYGEKDPIFVATLTSGSLVCDDKLEDMMSFTRDEGRNAGTYVIHGGCLDINYLATITNGTYTITPRPITVSIGDARSAYKQTIGQNPVQLEEGTLAYNDTLTNILTVSTPDSIGAGVYDIVAVANSNYSATFVYTHGSHSIYEIEKLEASENMSFNISDGEAIVQGTRVTCTVTELNLLTSLTYALNGESVGDTMGIGNYVVTATIVDNNYYGTKSLAFSTYEDVAPKMTTLLTLLDTYYSSTASDKDKINALFDCQTLYANLSQTDWAQIEANSSYQSLMQSFVEAWDTLRQNANEDMAVATKTYDNVLTAVLTAITAAACLAFVAIKILI